MRPEGEQVVTCAIMEVEQGSQEQAGAPCFPGGGELQLRCISFLMPVYNQPAARELFMAATQAGEAFCTVATHLSGSKGWCGCKPESKLCTAYTDCLGWRIDGRTRLKHSIGSLVSPLDLRISQQQSGVMWRQAAFAHAAGSLAGLQGTVMRVMARHTVLV